MRFTKHPFRTDIYDIQNPLKTFARGRVALLGDAAHPMCPHIAKGSNFAIQDAFVLACSAQAAESLEVMLQLYSSARVKPCTEGILLSRYMGKLRIGSLCIPIPHDRASFESQIRACGIRTTTLPESPLFKDIMDFMKTNIPEDMRGYHLKDLSFDESG